MRYNETNQIITQMREELIHLIRLYMHIMETFLKERNLNYENVLSLLCT